MIKLMGALGKMMQPSETGEAAIIVGICLLVLYAMRTIYKAPKSLPPQYKKYEEQKRRRQAAANMQEYARAQQATAGLRQRGGAGEP